MAVLACEGPYSALFTRMRQSKLKMKTHVCDACCKRAYRSDIRRMYTTINFSQTED